MALNQQQVKTTRNWCPVFWQHLSVFKRRRRFRKLHYALFFLSLALTAWYISVWWYGDNNEVSHIVMKKLEELELQRSIRLEKGTGCVMPETNPFSEEVMKFDQDMPKVTCEGVDWVECYYEECFVIQKILDTMYDVTCIYKDLIYIEDQKYDIGPPVKLNGNATYKLNRSDHVKVSCTGKIIEGSILRNIIGVRWFGNKAGFREVTLKSSPLARNDTLDVLILAFDSASRNGFLRRMPKSYKFITEELNAVVLKSFNVLGDGTTATLFPLLTGNTALELIDSNIKLLKSNYFDWKSFIFHTMGEDGYRTAFFEDMPQIGTFQLRFSGFRHQPADHYLRPLLLEETDNGKKWWKGIKRRYCMGTTPSYLWMLNLTTQFFKLKGKHFCLTFISDISHGDFNMITTAEDDLIAFLQKFRDDGRLENTLLIIMGDHGFRFTEIRNTFQGKLEERLPFLSIVLPEKLKRDRPGALSALKANADVLTTPFDVHATLLDVVGMKNRRSGYKVPGSDLPRAMSLLQSIPKSRSCGEAGVVTHWCACAKWSNVSSFDPIFESAARALAAYINKFTQEKRSLCAERKLTSILWVMKHGPNKEVLTNTPSFLELHGRSARAAQEYYQAKILMSPARAVFEGSMIYEPKRNVFRISAMDISRTTAYGDEPNCITKTHPHLRKYCYCRK